MNSEQHTNSMYICASIDLWISAEALLLYIYAHALSVFLARNSKINKFLGAVLILGAVYRKPKLTLRNIVSSSSSSSIKLHVLVWTLLL
jgi:hypothetical protein